MFAFVNRFLISTTLSLALVSCGGGTTGTSPTVVKLLGSAQDQNGSGISNTSMTVSSAPSGELLVASSTDDTGRFEMTLPSSETDLDVSVEGAAPLSIRRSISDSSAAFASVAVNSSNKQSSLASQVEARIVGSSCEQILFTPFSVDATAVADVPSVCEVRVEISTNEANAAPTAVAVSGVCAVGAKRSDLVVVETTGRETLSLDISPALRSSCEMLLIEVRSNGDETQAIQFELER
jgi:hypothetical protein